MLYSLPRRKRSISTHGKGCDMSDEWGPWIEHDGMGCPVRGMWVETITNKPGWTEDGVLTDRKIYFTSGPLRSWDWSYASKGFVMVIRYRVRIPRALQQLREMVENLPAPTKPVEIDA